MADKVLVAFGSKYGSTKEIAEEIGKTLQKEGLTVDVLPAVNANDARQYSAFVIGSAVYAGFWRKEAVSFVENNEGLLAERPVWIFSSGPTGEGEIKDLMSGWEYPKKLKPAFERIQPKDITVFHGAADPDKLSFFHKIVLKMVKAPSGDFRKWDEIETWAKSIAGELKK